MTLRRLTLVLSLILALAALGAVDAGASGIEGTWVLTHRVLPDGSEQHPPEVYGMLNYTSDLRNFNIRWPNPDGTVSTLSMLAGYVISGDEYCETVEIWQADNFGGTPGYSNEPPAVKSDECGTVAIDGDTWTLTVAGEPPTLTFTPDGMTAEAEGMFVDHWERVD